VSGGASATLLRRLGKRVRALRTKQSLTQEELAKNCGFSQKFLSELERGTKRPSWESLVSLCSGLGVSLSVLTFGVDEGEHEPRELTEIVAGRPEAARYEIAKAVKMLLLAGESKD
jgi:transcriptional regulator with XRE-family HTH domain